MFVVYGRPEGALTGSHQGKWYQQYCLRWAKKLQSSRVYGFSDTTTLLISAIMLALMMDLSIYRQSMYLLPSKKSLWIRNAPGYVWQMLLCVCFGTTGKPFWEHYWFCCKSTHKKQMYVQSSLESEPQIPTRSAPLDFLPEGHRPNGRLFAFVRSLWLCRVETRQLLNTTGLVLATRHNVLSFYEESHPDYFIIIHHP